ncbi:MAG: type III polyketide synthase [Bryobacteraceae bacterium]|nr:type III polyketide synthase [Bryobacteraceae bacterium]
MSTQPQSADCAQPVIAATAIAAPEHAVTREDARQWLQRVFAIDENRARAMLGVIDNSRIQRRFFVHPLERIIRRRPLSEIVEQYKEHSVRLGLRVAADCLARAGMTAADIDMIVTVSCTGFMIPSLDAYLINQLGLRSDVRRLPITELGCAAGACALSHAGDFVAAFPGASVLVVSVELSSLSLQRADLSQANLISSILFGDGAAAAIVTGRPCAGPRIAATESYFFPDSLDAMGFDLKDTGFHIVLSRDVPQMIQSRIRGVLDGFLRRNSVCPSRLSFFALHPGGQKLLSYMEQELGLGPDDTASSWRVLSDFGNLSSASVLFVLDDLLSTRRFDSGEYGLMAAFGPGFSAEMLLLRWAEA